MSEAAPWPGSAPAGDLNPRQLVRGCSLTCSFECVCTCDVSGSQAGRQSQRACDLRALGRTVQLLSNVFLGVVRNKKR